MNQTSHIVRTIYFKPVGILEVPKKKIRDLMQDSQAFYRAEMERHRYGTKTFRLETDRNDEVVVYTVNGKKQAEAYTSYQDIEPELPPELRDKNNIHVIFMGGLRFVKDSNTLGVGFSYYGSACGGIARIAAVGDGMRLSVVSHELGHAFGLSHNIRNGDFLMGPGTKALDDYEAQWLNKHRYFNNIYEFDDVQPSVPPKIINLDPIETQQNIIAFRSDIESINELHQAQILKVKDMNTGVLDWQPLKGKRDTAVFRVHISELVDAKRIHVQVMDTQGNINQSLCATI